MMSNDSNANPVQRDSNVEEIQTSEVNADLQIKPANSSGSTTGSIGFAQTKNTSQSIGSQAQSTSGIGSQTNQAGVVQPVEPINKRAFNLEVDIENSTTKQAIPEKFAIPKFVREKHPDLVDLIKSTESMDDQERQYWFQIVPIMTEEQIQKFKNILITEKQQLAELDREYEEELNKLNEKHILEWKEFESKEKARAIQEAEAKSDEEEKKTEEELLAKLSDI